jgi:hypothetical protein
MEEKYLMPTQDAGRAFMMRQIKGSVIMLNLIRFRAIADYSATPELMPKVPGEQAYQLYIEHTLPFLTESGGEILLMGEGGAFLIGPTNEHWDAVLLVRQNSVNRFLAFESNLEYLRRIGHRIYCCNYYKFVCKRIWNCRFCFRRGNEIDEEKSNS